MMTKPTKPPAAKKQTIYLDADDDITVIVEHIKTAKNKIIALVVPKRAETLKSVVNMKLLKRTAAQTKTQPVLITKDETISQIAANVGIYVADSLKTKPAIPQKKKISEKSEKKESAPKTASAATASTAKASKTTDPQKTTKASKTTDPQKTTKAKKPLKVPNFNAFRKRIFIALAIFVVLPLLWIVMFSVMPRGKVVISTNARSVEVNVDALLDDEAIEVEISDPTIPTEQESTKKQLSEKISATGEKEVGTKATGLMTISNCTDSSLDIPANTTFNTGGLNFISAAEVNLDSGNFTGNGTCKSTGGHVKTVSVEASEAGDQYNLSSRNYSAEGIGGDVTAFGSDMSGGSSEKVTIVQQSDIDTGISKLQAQRNDGDVKADLTKLFVDAGLIPLEDTFEVTVAEPKSSVSADQEVADGTITQDITYRMNGIKQSDVLTLVLPKLEEQAGNLKLIESGIDEAVYKTTKRADGYTLSISAKGSAGVLLTDDQVFEQIKQRPADEAAAELRQQEGVTSVEVSTSPFWVTSMPGNKSKVTIEINGTE